jgi:hypothetical protein
MARLQGSKNKVSTEMSETLVGQDLILVQMILALMANPNIYPKHTDSAIIAMAKRMIKEIENY